MNDHIDNEARVVRQSPPMQKTTPEQNKALVLGAFDSLFNKRDYVAAEKFWSPNYVQHSAHIPAGRDGLFKSDQEYAAHAEI